MARARVVPFVRPLRVGDHGKDVLALQLALRNFYQQKKLGKGPGRTGRFGTSTVDALATFQQRRAIKADRSGVYGLATHKQLAPHYGPSALAKLLEAKTARDQTGPEGVRVRIVAAAIFAYNNARFRMQYTQGGMRDDWLWEKVKPPKTPHHADCSSLATWTYWVPGAPDPSGWGYRAIGWTGSMILHGRRVNSAAAGLGALVYYPGSSGAIGHVAIKVGPDRVVSFGSEPIRLLPVAYRRVAFAIEPMV